MATRSGGQSSVMTPGWPVAAVVLLVLAIAPGRITGFIGVVRDPVEVAVSPVSGPVGAIAERLRGGVGVRSSVRDADRADLLEAYEVLQRRHFAAIARVEELETLVRELQGGVPYPSELAVSRMEAVRVGSDPPSTIEVRRGRRDGVTPGATIAVARGSQQLVGTVSRAGAAVSTVRLITDAEVSRSIRGVVVPRDGLPAGVALESLPVLGLLPDGAGRLVEVQAPVDVAVRIELGDVVRLLDDAWPSAAQMFVLGRVVAIDETDEPLFRRVTAVPLIDDLPRVRSVILHVPIEGGERESGREEPR